MIEGGIPELDRAGLRSFALTTSAILIVLFGLAIPWIFEFQYPLWPWYLGAGLSLAGLIVPMWLRPVYRTWMRFGLLMSKITTPLIMGIVFYLVLMPMGLVMRLMGKDPMAREMDSAMDSYRVLSEEDDKTRLEKPF